MFDYLAAKGDGVLPVVGLNAVVDGIVPIGQSLRR